MSWCAIVEAPDITTSRLAADYYAPESLETANAVRNSGFPIIPLADLVDAPINNSIRDITNELNVPGSSVPMFRPADMDGWWLSTASAPLVPASFEEQHKKARVVPGDIVLAIAGTVGKMGRVPPDVPYGCINGSSARIRPKPSVGPYLLAYLNSSYGQSALLRIRVGSVQRHLNLEDLPGLPIPMPPPPVQQHIGLKVELAERCRSQAASLQHELSVATEAFYQGVPITTACSRSTLVALAELNPTRIDAWYHQRHFIDLAKWLRNATGFREVSSLAELSISRWDPGEHKLASFLYVDISAVDVETGQILPVRVSVADAPSRARKLLSDGDVLVSTVRPNRKCIAVVPERLDGAVGSTGFAVLKTRSKYEAHLLEWLLNHDVSTAQLMQWNTGSTYPAIEEDAVLRIRVPWPSGQIHDRLAEAARMRHKLLEAASGLVVEAKTDVEALIGGTFNSDAIINGHVKQPTYEDLMQAATSKEAR
jgi:type I restriction enzyme S subunit